MRRYPVHVIDLSQRRSLQEVSQPESDPEASPHDESLCCGWGGLLSVLLAILLPSIIDGLTIFYGLLGVALFVPTLVGLYSNVPSAGTALGTIIFSVVVTLIVHVWTGGAGIGILTPYAIGIICALALTWVRMSTTDSVRR